MLSLAAALVAAEALAGDDPEAARDRAALLRADADRLFSEGKYDAALLALEHGYALTGDPLFVFNLGVTYHSQGNCAKARESYELYLDADPAGPKRAAAVQGLKDLDPICGKPESSPAESPASASRPLPALPSTPSKPSVTVVESPRLEATLGERIEPAPVEMGTRDLLKWSLLGASGAALALSGVMGVLWYDARSEHESLVQSAIGGAQTWDVCCARRDEAVQANRVKYAGLAIGFGIASVVLGGAGTALILLTPSTAAGPGVAAASYRFEF
jgi:tetratricopeptide (TPR) repeat protein